jgi:hypothetical protein
MNYLIGQQLCHLPSFSRPFEIRFAYSTARRSIIAAQVCAAGTVQELEEDQLAELEATVLSMDADFSGLVVSDDLPGWASSSGNA